MHKWAGVNKNSAFNSRIGNFNKKQSEIGVFGDARANKGVYSNRNSRKLGL